MSAAALCALALLAGEPAGGSSTRASGYLSLRGTWGSGRRAGDAAAPALARLLGEPELSLLAEGNLQLQVPLWAGAEARADLSLLVGSDTGAGGPLAAAVRTGNRLVPSELFLQLALSPNAGLLAGRKRVVWGSGLAWNPSDLLNPPKDPTDPAFQRAGAWMVRAEAPFERFTATALWAPLPTAEEAGLPRRFLHGAGSSPPQQLAAARLYALLADADWNLAWLWSDRYADGMADSHRLAASASWNVLRDGELHAEALVQRGRHTAAANPACLPPPGAPPDPLLACLGAGIPVVVHPWAPARAVYLQAIAGGRWTFGDESVLSLEYFHRGVGLAPAAFRDWLRLLGALADAAPVLGAAPALAAPGAAETGQPARFSFRPLRRHYLFLVWQKPRVADDFTVGATAIAGLEDGSALLAPSLAWSARQWLSLAVHGYFPFGGRATELGGLPFRRRMAVELRAWY